MKVSWKLFSYSLVLLSTLSWAAPLGDLVDHLPGYGRPPTTQFSGFLNATTGCDTAVNGDYCMIHYWLAMASVDEPTKAPVVLWLNGGPGSSSILGFLQELGPLLMNATGGLMQNPWGWTNVANVFAIEAPIGVGYSYCAVQKEKNKACVNTDRFTASASRAALVDFFTTKFPELAKNPFYITGESYAGVYIPTLANEILTNAKGIVNLKGIAVGDPCTDNTAQANSMDSLWYGHKYGLVDDAIFDVLWNHCDVRIPVRLTQNHFHVNAGGDPNQQFLQHLILSRHQHEDLDENDVVELDSKTKQSHQTSRKLALQGWVKEQLLQDITEHAESQVQDDPQCTLAYRKFLLSTSRGLSQSWKDLFVDDYSLFSPISNQEDEDMATYMMRDDVKRALHVEDSPTSTWPYASQGFHYHKEYDACNGGTIHVNQSMIDIYRIIVPQLEKTWVYNGDTDPCVSYEGTRTAVSRIGYDEIDGGGYRPWFYNQTAASIEIIQEKAPLFGPNLLTQPMGAQFGGEVVNYESGLSFFTIHGSGHMVPQFRPQASLHFIAKFLSTNTSESLLSPYMPKNETLMAMTTSEFFKAMDLWTEMAQSSPYVV